MIKFLKTQWYKIVYVVAVIIYLIFLNGLNHKLLRYNFENSFKLIEYDDYIALKFFAFAVIFIFIPIFFEESPLLVVISLATFELISFTNSVLVS